MKRRSLHVGVSLFVGLFWLVAGCDSVNLGAIAGFFAPGVTIEIINDTDFSAVPDLRTSDAGNIAADVVAEQQPVEGVGTIAPHQTATIRLTADGDLERLYFRGAKFSAGGSFPVGEVDDQTKLRRDLDFDGGDTIRIRLSGFILSFQATVNVDRASSNDRSGGSSPGSGGSSSNDHDGNGGGHGGNDGGQDGQGRDIGDLLDSLFG